MYVCMYVLYVKLASCILDNIAVSMATSVITLCCHYYFFVASTAIVYVYHTYVCIACVCRYLYWWLSPLSSAPPGAGVHSCAGGEAAEGERLAAVLTAPQV